MPPSGPFFEAPPLQSGITAAQKAAESGDYEAALWIFDVLRGDYPDQREPVLLAVKLLTDLKRNDEADRLLISAESQFPTDLNVLLPYARAAEAKRDWPEAFTRWSVVRNRFPDSWVGYSGSATALREMERFQEAEEILTQAVARFPDLQLPRHDLARIAERRRDWGTAERWWREFLSLGSGPWWAHTSLATALREQGRVDDADSVLLIQIESGKAEIPIFCEYARNAEVQRDPEAALARWHQMFERFPDSWMAYQGYASALQAARGAEHAEALLLTAAERFPQELGPRHDLARLAERRQDWPSAQKWWESFAAIDPRNWQAEAGIAKALIKQGDVVAGLERYVQLHKIFGKERPECLTEVAVAMAEHADTRFTTFLGQLETEIASLIQAGSDQLALYSSYAGLAKRREDFAEYRARLERAVEKFPQDNGMRIMLASARELAPAPNDIAVALSPLALPTATSLANIRNESERNKHLFSLFESLGADPDGGGCQFGLLQRRYALEPLSLLRWSNIPPEDLIRLIANRCDEVGDEKSISLQESNQFDWAATETGYNITIEHTHLDWKTVSETTARKTVATRMKFLSRKFMLDLEAGEKIFIYRMRDPWISSPDFVDRLCQALGRFPNAKFLLITEGRVKGESFEIGFSADNFIEVRRKLTEHHGPNADLIREDSWREICQYVIDYFNISNRTSDIAAA